MRVDPTQENSSLSLKVSLFEATWKVTTTNGKMGLAGLGLLLLGCEEEQWQQWMEDSLSSISLSLSVSNSLFTATESL